MAFPCSLQDARLGKDYDTLAIDINASPRERDPATRKCTMVSPHAHRHLRDVTGLAAQQRHPQNPAEAAADTDAPGASASAGSTPSSRLGDSRRNGGQLRVRVTADGILSRGIPGHDDGSSPAAELVVTVAGRDLHAPLIERIIELPMDIHEGRVRAALACLRARRLEVAAFEHSACCLQGKELGIRDLFGLPVPT